MRFRRRRIRFCAYFLVLCTLVAYLCPSNLPRIIETDVDELMILNSASVRTSADDDELEILELSIWYNSTLKHTTVHELYDASIIESDDLAGEFYIVGGYLAHYTRTCSKIQKINSNEERNQWIELQDVAIPAYLAKTHMGVSVYNNRLYVFTGQLEYGCGRATPASAYLNLSTGEWTKLPDVPEARYTPIAIISNNCVHLFAGAKLDRTTPAFDYWILNLDRLDQGWVEGPSLPQSGDHGRGALIDGWMYLLSFEHGHSPLATNHTGVWDGKRKVDCPGTYIAQPEVFKIHSKDARSSNWIRLSDMPRPVHHATSVVLNNRFILVIGGVAHGNDRSAGNVQSFDTLSNRWRLLSRFTEYAKSPLVWTSQEQSILYIQTEATFRRRQTQQAHIIWTHKPKTERCLFYTRLNCTTRKLERTPYAKYRRLTESRWSSSFSNVFLMNMPAAVERLRRVWYELNKIDLTSITLLESFQVQNITEKPILVQEDILWPSRMQVWKAKNDTATISRVARSYTSVKLLFMNLWTKIFEENPTGKPILIMEDDVQFIRSKDETFEILNKTLKFLQNHPEIEWDLLYLSYRNVEATPMFDVSKDFPIRLWRASKVYSNTAFIVNKHTNTTEKLNQCYLHELDAPDVSISSCLKHQLIRAYLIEPKVAQARPGISIITRGFEDYRESGLLGHMLGNHTPPAKFVLHKHHRK